MESETSSGESVVECETAPGETAPNESVMECETAQGESLVILVSW